ncbi:Os11g0450225 [Oryza sativa Japonica Group]|uniref:Os11g0450225 protein n=1 Tax=Oryza sativa subsp. japonica TaxID=39947 RepID=A0A0P0Y273_ORYSJ|nr:Os11g0450225 [Oryza sativa Japonica Group]
MSPFAALRPCRSRYPLSAVAPCCSPLSEQRRSGGHQPEAAGSGAVDLMANHWIWCSIRDKGTVVAMRRICWPTRRETLAGGDVGGNTVAR